MLSDADELTAPIQRPTVVLFWNRLRSTVEALISPIAAPSLVFPSKVLSVTTTVVGGRIVYAAD